MTDEYEKLMKAFIDSRNMEERAEYLREGRKFEQAPVKELMEAWAVAFRHLSLGDTQHLTVLKHLGAEIGLRGLDLPGDQVRDAVERIQSQVETMPAEARDALSRAFDKFVEDLARPKS